MFGLLRRELSTRWLARKFRKFERAIHPDTWANHDEILAWAEHLASGHGANQAMEESTEVTDDPAVQLGR
jgi:hypothetical protein